MEDTKSLVQLMYDIKNAYSNRNKTHEDIMALYRAFPDKNFQYDYDGNGLLHLAAGHADFAALEYLLGEGVKPTIKDTCGQTALHFLARCRRDLIGRESEDIAKSVSVLLGARLSALIRDEGAGGNLCYHQALKSDNLPFIYAMMDNKVKLDMLDKDGRNVLHLLVRYPAESARHTIQYTGQEEKKQQCYAILDECFALAQALIEYGIDPDAKDRSSKSAADYAVEKGLPKLAVLLRGEYDTSDPTLEDKITAGGLTLHEAVKRGDVAAVEALLRLGADPNEVDTTPYGPYLNLTPLAVACSTLKVDCARALLEGGAQVDFRGGEKGWSAFYCFVSDLSYRGNESERKKSMEEIMGLLFDAGLDPNGFVDDQGHTPLNLACSSIGHDRYKSTVRSYLFDMGVCDYNKPNLKGVTPLMGICIDNYSATENDLISLLENGADMTARDSEGNTALIYAARNRDRAIALTAADLLFSFGDPIPAATNNEGKSAMDFAVENNNENLVKFLLERM